MKVLCSSVLAIESIVVFLASLVASTNGSVSSRGLAIGLGSALAVVLIAAVGTLRRPWGVALGWVLQVVVVALGFFVPLMFVVGGIFALLWFVAVRTGSRVDALRAAHAAAEQPAE
ncbi:MAG: DUF4233 domain-containing protein [Actinobacteria bacterium]|uniref:Unannotated protein n=1 Tax=freshwater metagenome TaxID=449393 RepID=A0A6J7CJ52_9ZZZZ|nr:DUF4233 domain-containing protein [Actinomycetota bacterium]